MNNANDIPHRVSPLDLTRTPTPSPLERDKTLGFTHYCAGHLDSRFIPARSEDIGPGSEKRPPSDAVLLPRRNPIAELKRVPALHLLWRSQWDHPCRRRFSPASGVGTKTKGRPNRRSNAPLLLCADAIKQCPQKSKMSRVSNAQRV